MGHGSCPHAGRLDGALFAALVAGSFLMEGGSTISSSTSTSTLHLQLPLPQLLFAFQPRLTKCQPRTGQN
ncbi:hypothetical protein CEP53_007859 [Fusarium sp. AF-6]|nr:hypothetical protein CEP53_007859 [Fusarium sp. AF-6]